MFNVLRTIYNSKNRDKSNFDKKIVEQLIKKDYLELNSESLTFTETGKKYLNQYKVDNAIIMAAGFGSKFVPFTYNIPQGLIMLNKEVMIERLIRQLHEVNISDITVVTGHLAKEYDYLKDKFNVRLIYNDEYKGTANNSSFMAAKKHLKNTYVLDSNIYISKNVLKEHEKDSWLECKKSKKNEDDCSLGLAFLNSSLSKVFISYTDKNSFVEIPELMWKDNLTSNFDDIKIKDHPTVSEILSLKQLEDIDPEFLRNSKNEIFDTIVKVFDVEYNDITDIVSMKKGMTNLSFLFSVKGERYVFRVPGRGTDLLIARSQEAIVYDKIAQLDIADEIVYMDPDKGYKITKYYDEIRTLDPYSDQEVKLAMQKVRLLHEANLEVDHHFNIVERIDYYRSICKDLDVKFSEEYFDITNKIEEIILFIKEDRTEFRLCHIDPVPSNFLVFNDMSVRLIDWEYSGMSDPIMDVAMFGIYQDYSTKQVDNLLITYLEREPTAYEFKVFYGYVSLTSYLWYLWTIYKEALGDYYGEYAQTQLDYSHKYSEKYKGVKSNEE